MANPSPLAGCETAWLDKHRYADAECKYYTALAGGAPESGNIREMSVEKKDSGKKSHGHHHHGRGHGRSRDRKQSERSDAKSDQRVEKLENENKILSETVRDLQAAMSKLDSRLSTLEGKGSVEDKKPQTKKEVEEDDDVDLFGSEDEEEEKARQEEKEKRIKAYTDKKSKKPSVVAKSSVVLDCKPWDDETDMKKMEECVRSIVKDGLVWGASKLAPVAFNVKKLQIVCVVEDDKVGIEELSEEITGFEDYIQSVDIAAFNKI